MFYIYCPYCQEHREEEEFHAAGQAHISRPLDPDNCSDVEWGDYLYFRKNPRGLHHEMWSHTAGCRKYFNVTRDTQSYQIKEVYKMGELPQIVAEKASDRERSEV
ncbi:sarcosine oxidase subunit delta [Shewanella psychropiezotolerans]|uniref:Sarcosine oxidase subunit delta n=2 Tax=Shewanella TaxID=22 RepID=A0ABX5X1V8_9GAMM|nr:sarcosine oxidase subunit delta [Shewanella psychropiezotolerans]MPY24646.1 sarcosine oxidase subunit delta [Shewanella sp. YLB-07]QDO83938.1 sarcosine oxidase subunit delta [Shewanella psychropiezotolerans]